MTDSVGPRFPVLDTASMNDEQRGIFDRMASGPRGNVPAPFLVLLHSPDLAERVQAVGEYIRFDTTLEPALNELAILVTAHHWRCRYEWYYHAPLARQAGLAEATIASIAAGLRPTGLSNEAAAIYDFCRAANHGGQVSDADFAAVREKFGLRAALDLLALCGYYGLLALVLNAAQVPLPDGAEITFGEG